MANFTKTPTVLVSPKHSTSGGNIDPQHNAISAWIEVLIHLILVQYSLDPQKRHLFRNVQCERGESVNRRICALKMF